MADTLRFPEGEPSVKSVLAALRRAQQVALARAAAVEAGSLKSEAKTGMAESGEGRPAEAAVEPSEELADPGGCVRVGLRERRRASLPSRSARVSDGCFLSLHRASKVSSLLI